MVITDTFERISKPARAWRSSKASSLGRISAERYAQHSRSPGVQQLIVRARRAWKDAHGSDPAAARIRRSP